MAIEATMLPAIRDAADLIEVWASARALIARTDDVAEAVVMRVELKAIGELTKLRQYGQEHELEALKMLRRAEYRIGQLLREEQEAGRLASRDHPNPNGRGGKNGRKNILAKDENVPDPKPLAEVAPDISYDQAAEFKQLATISEESLEEGLAAGETSRVALLNRAAAAAPPEPEPSEEFKASVALAQAWRSFRISLELLRDELAELVALRTTSPDVHLVQGEDVAARKVWKEIVGLIGEGM